MESLEIRDREQLNKNLQKDNEQENEEKIHENSAKNNTFVESGEEATIPTEVLAPADKEKPTSLGQRILDKVKKFFEESED